MATKLTTKTIRLNALLSIGAMLIIAPIFYFMIDSLWIEDIDESMIYEKEELLANVKSGKLSSSEFELYATMSQKLGGTIEITKLEKNELTFSDSIYYRTAYDSIHKHEEPYREYRTSISVENTDYKVVIKRDLVESEDLVESIIKLFVALLVILLLLTVFVMTKYSAYLWRPFFTMVQKLKDMRINRLSTISVECQGTYEFEQLQTSIDELLEKNHKIFNSQKEFTENAAHEIQTPIAVIKMQMDMLRQRGDMSEDETRAIQTISGNIRYISALSRNLLLLSKIENRSYLLTDNVNVFNVINSLVENVSEELEMVGKGVEVKGNNIELKNCNEVLFRSLCNNLLTNAIKYSKLFTKIEINLSEKYIEFSNQGGSEPLDSDKIFERFYKGNPTTSGSGLGLSIVKSICDILGFKVEYTYLNNKTHTFRINF